MIRINLLPVREHEKQRSSKQLLVLFAVLIVMEIAGLFYLQSEEAVKLAQIQQSNAKIEAELKTVTAKTAKVAQREKEKEELETQKRVLDTLIEGQNGPVRVLVSVSEMLSPIQDAKDKLRRLNQGWDPDWDPKRLWIDAFSEQNRVLSLSGHARSNDDVAEILRRLNSSPHFVKINLNLSEVVKLTELGGITMVRFSISALVLYGAADAKRLALGELGVKKKKRH